MPVGQVQNILLALEDGYKRHVGHRVKEVSDVFSPFNKLLCMYGCKRVLIIPRRCVDGVDVPKNHAQDSRHPAVLISFTKFNDSKFREGYYVLGIRHWSQHHRLSMGTALANMIGINLVIIRARWKLLVNIVVMKRSWSSKCHAEIIIQSIGAPKCPSPAFYFYTIDTISMTLSV
jgi:hypothetical protein